MVVSYGLPGFFAYGALIGEVLAPLMLLFGFYARIGAIIVAINMLFAFGLAHLGQIGQLNDQGGWALELQGMFLFTEHGRASGRERGGQDVLTWGGGVSLNK